MRPSLHSSLTYIPNSIIFNGIIINKNYVTDADSTAVHTNSFKKVTINDDENQGAEQYSDSS